MKTKQLQQNRMLAIIMLTLSSFINIFAQSVGSTFTVDNFVRWARGTAESGYVKMTFKVISTESNTVEGYWATQPDPFYEKRISEIEIPEYVTYNNRTWRVSSIGAIDLYSKQNFVKAILPELLETLGDNAFYNFNYRPFEIVGAETVRKIGYRAFYNCSKNTSFIDLTHVEEIGRAAFYRCDSLHIVYLPNIKKLEPAAFMWSSSGSPHNTTRGLSEIVLGNDLEEIPDSCFLTQSYLKDFEIPSNINRIGKRAFKACSHLQHVVIPEKVKTIEVATFHNCTRMSYIELPSGLTQIKDSAFYYCSSLDTIVAHSKVPPSLGSNVFYNCRRSVLYVPYGCKAAYQAANYWKQFKAIIEMEPPYITFADENVKALCVANWDSDGDGELSYNEAAAVTSLGQVFRNNSTITSFNELSYFTGVSSIGINTFRDCSGLTSLTIPESATNIGQGAFHNCSGLTSINIPKSVNSIAFDPFGGCSGLETIIVSSNNATFDSRNNCNAIIRTATNRLIRGCKNTIIPNSATSIGDYAFDGCTGLTSITIPNSVKSISEGAFADCSDLISVTIPEGVTSIGTYAFLNCSSLTSLTIPNSVTSVGSKVLNSCVALESLVVESNNTTYNSGDNSNAIIKTATNELIYGCKNTNIPNSVTCIGDYAFYGCTGLASVSIPNCVTSIGSAAFSSCNYLTSIVIPNSVTSIGSSAFFACNRLTSVTVDIVTPLTISSTTFSRRAIAPPSPSHAFSAKSRSIVLREK